MNTLRAAPVHCRAAVRSTDHDHQICFTSAGQADPVQGEKEISNEDLRSVQGWRYTGRRTFYGENVFIGKRNAMPKGIFDHLLPRTLQLIQHLVLNSWAMYLREVIDVRRCPGVKTLQIDLMSPESCPFLAPGITDAASACRTRVQKSLAGSLYGETCRRIFALVRQHLIQIRATAGYITRTPLYLGTEN